MNKKNEIVTNKNYDIELVKEGIVEIQIPTFNKVSSKAPVFYNTKMEFNRDISILALKCFQEEIKKKIDICDVFGGSGIRGVRYKKEINNVGTVTINDINPLAIEFAKINSEINNVNVEIYEKEANILLRQHRGEFDCVDIDPFGTPSYFIDSAGYSLKKDSLLCVTATDTSALCGTYIEPCIRKYNAKPYKSEYCHENGIRILTGFIALTLAKYKKYLEVKLSHSSEHYMRLYLKIKKGSAATDKSLDNMGYICHCKKCLYRKEIFGLSNTIPNNCPICEEKLIITGPLWIGSIQNSSFIKSMIKKSECSEINTKKQVLKLLNTCFNEANAPITFYDIHVICRNLKISAPKINDVLDTLNEKGFISTRTHFNPIGIKTNVGIEKIKDIIRSLVD